MKSITVITLFFNRRTEAKVFKGFTNLETRHTLKDAEKVYKLNRTWMDGNKPYAAAAP